MSVTGWGCDVAIVIGNNSRRNTYMFPSVCGLNPFAKISNISLLCKFLGFFCQKWLTDHRNLNGIYTDVLGVAYGKKSLGEIFNEIWPLARNQSSSEFNRLLDGCFLVARAQEIFCGNLFLDVAPQEIF